MNTFRQTKKLAVLVIFFSFYFSDLAQGQKMNINQTLSDGAQKMTIAFNGLAFLSGDFCSCTFVPPGKVSDYFGFQYLRDNDKTNMGHNTDFLTCIANNMLYVLNDDQKNQIISVAKSQVNQINEYAYERLPMIYAFNRLLNKDIPSGSKGLSKDAVKSYSAKLYRLDGQISIKRALLFGSIIKGLGINQRHYLDSVAKLGMKNMPFLPDQIDKKGLTNNEFVAVMTYASEMFAWYAGKEESDVYFCPERQGDYFGSFYLKDAPAMGNPGYSIDTNLTQNGGQYFLNALTASQAKLITNLVDTQKTDLYDIVARRTAISKLLRNYLTADNIDTASVLSISGIYGELDGEISYYYAANFAKVGWTLTSAQKDTLHKLRNLDDFPCSGAYIYSEKIPFPDMINTDFFFFDTEGIDDSFGNEHQLNVKASPNPFNDNLNISLSLPLNSKVEIGIFDSFGKQIKTYSYDLLPSGNHIMRWNGTNDTGSKVAAGVYYCVIKSASETRTIKLSYLK